MESVLGLVWLGLQYVAALAGATIVVYVLVRAGSFAYFRTRLEHVRRTLREIKGDRDDG